MTGTAGGVVQSGRRAFLKWATAVGGVLSTMLAGVPALRAFLSPTFRHERLEKWIPLGEAGAFDLDAPLKVDFVDSANDAWVETRRLRNVWVYTADGENFTVYNGRCTHLGCNYFLDEQEKVFRCPCHTGYFEIKSGAVLGGPPPRALDAHDLTVLICPESQKEERCPSTSWWSTAAADPEERRVAFVAVTRSRGDFMLCVSDQTFARLQQKRADFVGSFRCMSIDEFMAERALPRDRDDA